MFTGKGHGNLLRQVDTALSNRLSRSGKDTFWQLKNKILKTPPCSKAAFLCLYFF
ncbi:hypothetical protein GYA13_03790 [Candidatus Kuenenbacteria bacterium]|nr:hypothetical protein [Candidatus Kuenenbacteria bacterium]